MEVIHNQAVPSHCRFHFDLNKYGNADTRYHGIKCRITKWSTSPVAPEMELLFRRESLHSGDGDTSLDYSSPEVENSRDSFPLKNVDLEHKGKSLEDNTQRKHKRKDDWELEEDLNTPGTSNNGCGNVQKTRDLSSNYGKGQNPCAHSSTSGWMEENDSTSDESFNNDLLGYNSSDVSESVDLNELNNIRDDIISSNDEDGEEKTYEQDPADSEDEQERWDRISRTVERMKLLLMKYPKFTSRVGNNKIITALHAMMDTLVDRKSPTSADIKMVEEQMENFKSVLFAGIEEDLIKWKSQRRSYRFYILRCFTLLAIMAAIASVAFKYSSMEVE
ncbi:unnamed protein product [Allacma fusca]|uniref:Uncharacterized protein n=1 Tax=Allacma fusca TaxID=39272 RepID=A0A8J2J815_9HEXA|nr:unnamed protein product [Allacma fusca]